MSHGKLEMFGKLAHFSGSVSQHDAPANVYQGMFCYQQLFDDFLGSLVIHRRLDQLPRVFQYAVEQFDVNLLRENIHRHVDKHRSRTPAFRQDKGLLQNFRKQMH